MEIKQFKNEVERNLSQHNLNTKVDYSKIYPNDNESDDYSVVIKTRETNEFIISFNISLNDVAITRVIAQSNFSELYIICYVLNNLLKYGL